MHWPREAQHHPGRLHSLRDRQRVRDGARHREPARPALSAAQDAEHRRLPGVSAASGPEGHRAAQGHPQRHVRVYHGPRGQVPQGQGEHRRRPGALRDLPVPAAGAGQVRLPEDHRVGEGQALSHGQEQAQVELRASEELAQVGVQGGVLAWRDQAGRQMLLGVRALRGERVRERQPQGVRAVSQGLRTDAQQDRLRQAHRRAHEPGQPGRGRAARLLHHRRPHHALLHFHIHQVSALMFVGFSYLVMSQIKLFRRADMATRPLSRPRAESSASFC